MYTVTISNVTREELEEIRAITKHDLFPGVTFEKEWDAAHLAEWARAIVPDAKVDVSNNQED